LQKAPESCKDTQQFIRISFVMEPDFFLQASRTAVLVQRTRQWFQSR
jgi:hypothetical protein